MDMIGIGLLGMSDQDRFWAVAQGKVPFIGGGTDWAKQQLQDHPDLFVKLMKDVRNKPDGEEKSKDLSTLEEAFNQLPEDSQQKLISELNQSDTHDRYLNQMDQYLGQEAGMGAAAESGFPPTSGADSLTLTSL